MSVAKFIDLNLNTRTGRKYNHSNKKIRIISCHFQPQKGQGMQQIIVRCQTGDVFQTTKKKNKTEEKL